MACLEPVSRMQFVVRAWSTTTWSFLYFGRWFSTPGPVDANLIVKVTNVTGDVVVTPSVQYAAVRRANPGAPAELDATGTTGTAMFAATLATSGTSWAQLGVGVKLSQGTYGEAMVEVTVFRRVHGEEVGMSDVQVQPSPLGQTIYVPVGGARPTLGVTHLKAGLWITASRAPAR